MSMVGRLIIPRILQTNSIRVELLPQLFDHGSPLGKMKGIANSELVESLILMLKLCKRGSTKWGKCHNMTPSNVSKPPRDSVIVLAAPKHLAWELKT